MGKAMGGEHPRTTGAEYKPNEFYERLIVLRETNPAGSPASARRRSPR
ncbi:MAG: hypothetical protein M3430_20445 [Acidobacteriota bacterium]|nr:hypothetical protein [Acidobacteriota bacterium]